MSAENQEPLPEQAGLAAQPEQSVGRDRDNVGRDRDTVDLALRFLVGLMALGGEEAAQRLQEMQRKLDEDPALWRAETPAGEKTVGRQAWHLGVGLLNRGQKRLRKGVREGYDRSVRVAGRLSSASDRWGAGRLTRPVRRPIERQLLQWRKEAILIEIEGELEEQQGRALATGTLGALTLEIMDEIAANPELLAFVQDLLSQQGRGMATSVVDNSRSLTLTADDAAEGLLRWLFRRTPRRALPASPVEGQPQTMYVPTARVEGGVPDVD